MVVMVWLPSGGLFCGRLAGVMFCTFLGVFKVPVPAGLMLLSQDLLNIRAALLCRGKMNAIKTKVENYTNRTEFQTTHHR
jgi:hypothetical protein